MNKKTKAIQVFVGACSFLLAFGILLIIPAVYVSTTPAEVKGTAILEDSIPDYATLASLLADKVNEISPSPSFDRQGWVVQRVVFAEGESKAYLEYTDTHVTLRLLLSYAYGDGRLATRVLGTFIPNEAGGWILQFGKDDVKTSALLPLYFDGDSNQWLPEVVDNN